MTSIVVSLLIIGMAVLAYFKVPLVQVLATIIVALLSSFVAFGYYELVGGLLAGFVAGIAPWAYMIGFLLLFVLVFAILQTGVVTLLKGQIDLGLMTERIGRPISGVILGWIAVGVLLVSLSLSPLSSSLPYARFDAGRPNLEEPQTALLNADGFIVGCFKLVSGGSFRAIRNQASFGLVRAGFLDQLSLNRLKSGVSQLTSTKPSALTAPSKQGVWLASSTLMDENGEVVTATPGAQLMVVRLGIPKKMLKEASPFTMAQVSVVCKVKKSGESGIVGTGQAVYPLGYLKGREQLIRKSLTESETVDASKVKESQKWYDFVFDVPSDMTPVVGRFKRNNMVTLSAVVNAEDAPESVASEEKAATDKPSAAEEAVKE